ncbi:hypothetical protein C4564_01085 [Candidatus Microgenomates bacterium]|nr:MAG: hypothetical protein C4564_01085 [Candidatus Microgenomates bacterium]
MNKFALIIVSLTLLLLSNSSALASNNHFGIHIFDESDLVDAANLVNSNGGEWGYVTLVIREDERNTGRWQRVFNEMRRLKLIPIVRIASKNEGGVWLKPTDDEAENWAMFLNSLNWPVKNRYIILFNEPNHAYEWGGQINPQEYAKTARVYLEKLKEYSYDFFVMPAALDLAAPNGRETMDAAKFFAQMNSADEYLLSAFDGLASHSYPNPGFSGSTQDNGKMSIRGYQWELDELSKYSFPENAPVFITETGWLAGNKSEQEISQYFTHSFQNVWSDPRIMAITPFILNYNSKPFDDFSWKNPETGEFREYYMAVQDMPKQKGAPEQIHAFETVDTGIANQLITDSSYSFQFKIKNTGQSIWSTRDGFSFHFDTSLPHANVDISPVPPTEPGQEANIPIRIFTEGVEGEQKLTLAFNKNGKNIGKDIEIKFNVIAPPTLVFSANFLFSPDADNVNLKITSENLSWSFENIVVSKGAGGISALYNIIPGGEYLYELSRPGFIAKRVSRPLNKGVNNIDFGLLLPLDFNGDNQFNWHDILIYFANPVSLGLGLVSLR